MYFIALVAIRGECILDCISKRYGALSGTSIVFSARLQVISNVTFIEYTMKQQQAPSRMILL